MSISLFGNKVNLNMVLIIIVIVLLLIIFTGCSCYNGAMNSSMFEGFTGANINNGQSSPYKLNDYSKINTDKWSASDMTDSTSDGYNAVVNRKKQPVPLPKGEMLLFATTPFKPECCPNTFSNSRGCACMTVDQYNYLKVRGGNNVPYSRY